MKTAICESKRVSALGGRSKWVREKITWQNEKTLAMRLERGPGGWRKLLVRELGEVIGLHNEKATFSPPLARVTWLFALTGICCTRFSSWVILYLGKHVKYSFCNLKKKKPLLVYVSCNQNSHNLCFIENPFSDFTEATVLYQKAHFRYRLIFSFINNHAFWQGLMQMYEHPCSWQHYSQQPKGGINPGVYGQMNR